MKTVSKRVINLKVEDVMNKDIEFIESDATVREAVEKMLSKGIRSLVVEPSYEGDSYGVITVRDIVFGVIANGLKPEDVKVKDIASKPIVTVPKGTKLKDVIKFMKRFNIARVFVVDDGKLVGVVALMDVMRSMV